jgi:exodeoxyribonuclease VII large subunit
MALNWEPERRYFRVSELASEIRMALADFSDLFVLGEISGVKLAASGHYYFTLKDEEAQIRCVCYRMSARYLKFKPQDGIAVLARGRVDFYDARGDLQMIVETLEPQGFGALQLAFEQLKKKLAAEGLFEQARKRPLPPLPERIGIVTSPSGAVIRDILNILERRCPGRHIRVYPAQVQGEGAVEQIAAGLEYFSQSGWAEVVILARGGGSLEDLWAFNEERVARAIAASAVPVVSAVGHETDFTIADFVADLRAPTPSAAAELITATRASLMERLNSAERALRQAARLEISVLSRRLHALAFDPARLHRMLGRRSQALDDLEYRLRDRIRSGIAQRRQLLDRCTATLARRDIRLQLGEARRRLDALDASIQRGVRSHVSEARHRFGPLAAHLAQLSPLKILARGYAIVQRDGTVVKSPADAPAGSQIRVRLAQGELGAQVTQSPLPVPQPGGAHQKKDAV